jgi:hypothetical protein
VLFGWVSVRSAYLCGQGRHDLPEKCHIRLQRCVSYDVYEANEWLIGSGEVESVHRYLPQDRMKKAKAQWLREHVNPMFAELAVRANKDWEEYWEEAA